MSDIYINGFDIQSEGGEKMKLSYGDPPQDEKTLEIASQILDILTRSGLSYQQADGALTAAQTMLGEKTRPVIMV